ncbi:flagellar protein FlaG [Algicola sagamiensis]|uniref:flagellar protein FlaG n=1 Tax=Algicola sagamiensis TaxID=163869 RepID=UPI000378373D|nr:flagellar protein FlaG [Algicola sagamiensis]
MANDVLSVATDRLSNTELPATSSSRVNTDLSQPSQDKAKDTPVENVQAKQAAQKVKETQEALEARPFEALEQTITAINELVPITNTTLQFRVDEDAGKQIVTVFDAETDDVIRQIPSEEFLKVAKKIQQLADELGNATGLVFDSSV